MVGAKSETKFPLYILVIYLILCPLSGYFSYHYASTKYSCVWSALIGFIGGYVPAYLNVAYKKDGLINIEI